MTPANETTPPSERTAGGAPETPPATPVGVGSVVLRRARLVDVPCIEGVVAAAYRMYLGRMDRFPAPMLRDHRAVVDAGDTWVVGDPITGVISFTQDGESLLIENVAVDPAVQGSGLGRRLMHFAEQQAIQRGLGRLRLYTHEAMTENQAIYRHLGYQECDRRTDEGYRRVFMEKVLPVTAPGRAG